MFYVTNLERKVAEQSLQVVGPALKLHGDAIHVTIVAEHAYSDVTAGDVTFFLCVDMELDVVDGDDRAGGVFCKGMFVCLFGAFSKSSGRVFRRLLVRFSLIHRFFFSFKQLCRFAKFMCKEWYQ